MLLLLCKEQALWLEAGLKGCTGDTPKQSKTHNYSICEYKQSGGHHRVVELQRVAPWDVSVQAGTPLGLSKTAPACYIRRITVPGKGGIPVMHLLASLASLGQ